MKLKYFSFFLLLITFLACENVKNNIVKINNIHNKINSKANDSILFYLNQANRLIRSSTNIPDSIKAKNNYLFGNYFYANNNKKLAFKYYNEAIDYAKEKITSNVEKDFFYTLAYNYKKNGDYLNSISVLNKLEKGIYNQNDYFNLAEIYNQKQSIFKLLKNYKKAIFFNKKSIKYYTLAKDTSKLVNNLILQANLNYYNFKNKKEAYRLLDSVLSIDLKENKNKNILKNQVFQSYGIFKYYDKNYSESYKNYKKAIGFLKKPITKSDSIALANSYANISEVCLDLKKYSLAKKYNDSVNLFFNVLNYNLKNFHLHNKLRLSFETNTDFKVISKDLDNLNSIMNLNYEKRITNELIALKKANQKEKELLITNQKEKRKKLLLFVFIGILLFSSFIVYLVYRQKILKQKNEEIFMQQRLFRAQMNPHFTSNILYTIQNLILSNKEKANRYLIKFTRLLRLNLENSMHNYTLIEKELELLAKYLDLQQLRIPNKFEYKMNTNDLDIDLLYIPPMLIQPFVENAIEHGFKNIDYKGFITIELIKKEPFIHCVITDNGTGIKVNNEIKKHVSASTLLIKKLLKKMTHKEVIIKNNKTKGTHISFYIPYKHSI